MPHIMPSSLDSPKLMTNLLTARVLAQLFLLPVSDKSFWSAKCGNKQCKSTRAYVLIIKFRFRSH